MNKLLNSTDKQGSKSRCFTIEEAIQTLKQENRPCCSDIIIHVGLNDIKAAETDIDDVFLKYQNMVKDSPAEV